jgi:hypothetical protein
MPQAVWGQVLGQARTSPVDGEPLVDLPDRDSPAPLGQKQRRMV